MAASTCILVTGGAGFVGAHVVRAALARGERVVVLDDLSSGHAGDAPGGAVFARGDIADAQLVRALCREHAVTAVVHCAGKIDVAESLRLPAVYMQSNLVKAVAMLEAVVDAGVRIALFSSTAAVYGEAATGPLPETAPLAPTTPYGASKLAFEHVLAAYGRARGLRWAALRYFNAAGADPDGTLTERHDPETHLIPLALDAALGRRPPLTVFGDRYPTPDGTCVRDYVHVTDLARGHLDALDALARGRDVGAVNLGSGTGSSVTEVLAACAEVIGKPVPHAIGDARPGDVPVLVADIRRAHEVLAWEPTRDLHTIVRDALRSRR